MAALAAIAFSGCFGQGTPSPPDEPSAGIESQSESATETSGDAPIPLLPEVSDDLILTDCVSGKAFQNYPGPFAPGGRPEGWQPSDPDDISSVGIDMYACQRIFVGGFERGPVHLLFEGHSNAAWPEACYEDMPGQTHFNLVTNAMIDDPELGQYLVETYGLEVQLASFRESTQDAGPSALQTFAWTLPGGDESQLTILDNRQDVEKNKVYDRYLWTHGDQLVSLQIDPTRRGSTGDWPANGTLASPMVLGTETAGHFVGMGGWYSSLEGLGTFTRYSDYFCSEKLP